MQPLTILLTTALALTSLIPSTTAHGAPEHPSQTAFRRSHEMKMKRSLDACGARLARRDLTDKRAAVRDQLIDHHLESMGLTKRGAIYPRDFAYDGANSSCILTPEGEEGPYYVNGSLIRHDVREGQGGVPLLLDVQVTDVRTCSPISGVMLDFWSANSTGVYSGMEVEDTLGETQLRGLRKTDEYGLAQLLTNVPGWYQGRAQHIHVKAYVNYTTLANRTLATGSGSVVHTGQMFFQQDTLSQINQIYPYTLDTNTITLNTADQVIQGQQNTSYYDAFVEMRSMGYNLTTGMVGFINIAIDPTSTPAAVGGNAGGSMGGGAGNGTMPSGGMPSGSMSGAMPSGTPSSRKRSVLGLMG